jgi:hypothetical protein
MLLSHTSVDGIQGREKFSVASPHPSYIYAYRPLGQAPDESALVDGFCRVDESRCNSPREFFYFPISKISGAKQLKKT